MRIFRACPKKVLACKKKIMAKAGALGRETRLGIGKAKNPFKKSGFSRLYFF
jgi:hypothetical protein